MKYLNQLMSLVVAFAATTACSADQPSFAGDVSAYEYQAGSRNGIGKFYLGREISHVMGHRFLYLSHRQAGSGGEGVRRRYPARDAGNA